jgi:hypothetical protein
MPSAHSSWTFEKVSKKLIIKLPQELLQHLVQVRRNTGVEIISMVEYHNQ